MKTLSENLDVILRKIYLRHGPLAAELMINWSRIVGPEIACISYPYKISQQFLKETKIDILYVKVNSASSSVKIKYQQDIILERISLYFGYKAINEIRLKLILQEV